MSTNQASTHEGRAERVLITGAAGFLGSHLCDRFTKDGLDVIAMDNLITGDMRNIEHLLSLSSRASSNVTGCVANGAVEAAGVGRGR